jgi:TatD DNase family protein
MEYTGLPLEGLIDSHFHLLEMRKRGLDPETVLRTLAQQGFAGGLDVGISWDDVQERLSLLSLWPNIRIAAGIGPWGAQGEDSIEDAVIRFAAKTASYGVDCIGEIGLDNYWRYGTPARQHELFIRQLQLAKKWKLPIAIHTRDADSVMARILQERDFPQGGILHCFSSSWEVAKAALDKGLHISFAGPITYRKNEGLRHMLAAVPDDRLLLETDSPYLAPEPYRGHVNTPAHMVTIYAEAARIRGVTAAFLAESILSNFNALFPIRDRPAPLEG